MPTEVILNTKVPNLGAEADIVKVKPGYARNYLIPRNLASPATKASKKKIEDLQRKRAEREAAELNAAQELAGKLGKLDLEFTLKTAEGSDKFFGSVTSQDIANKISELGYEVDRKKIDLPKGIKDTGMHEVIVDLGHGINGKLKVNVAVETPASEEEEEAPKKRSKKG